MARYFERVDRLVTVHAATRDALNQRADVAVRRIVAGFDGWYDAEQITALTKQLVSVVESSQRGVASATDAYLSRVATELVGKTVLPVGPIDPSTLREGVTHEGAYGRLADQYRYETSLGKAAPDVMSAVLARAASMAATDQQLAFTHQSQRFMKRRGAEGWRRIIHPELSKSGTCGLCLAASDRMYTRGDLMPLHGGSCHCGVLPVMNGEDPGRDLNQADLERVYAEAGSAGAKDLRAVRFEVHEHGEIGPVLGRKGDKFRGPGDVPS